VVLAYKNRNSYDRLMFIFASDDFNQAYKRLKYFEEYSHHRKFRAKELDQFRQILSSKVQDLEAKRKEHAKLLGENESEKNALAGEKEEKVGLISSLKNKEKELQDEVKQKNLQALKIKKEIDKIIEEELKKLQPKKPKAGDNKKPVAPKITLTPEEELVNSGFEGNRGKLPWPTREGVITQYFGTYQHPEVPGVELNNNGIDITTNKGAEIRAIYDGEVVVAGALGGIPGMVIIIKHGEYFSVYQGLESVSVKKGDKVKTKQSIGKAFTDDDNKTGVHFELYKGKLLLNPQHWISKG
jgi:murein hydrolase activator